MRFRLPVSGIRASHRVGFSRSARAWAFVSASVAMLLVRPALAWGGDGHRLVARYAYEHLSLDARIQVDRLLAQEAGSTLESVSTWADEVRSPSTASWHYVNFRRDSDCSFDVGSMCLQGSCLVGAVERQLAILSSTASDAKRLLALKYVVHLVADAHQPLHAGFSDDRGGNLYQINVLGRGTNLHALWDSEMIRLWPGGSGALKGAINAIQESGGADSPTAWVEASCRIASDADFYPPRHVLDDEYIDRWSKQLSAQLAKAGRALAKVLEASMGQHLRAARGGAG